MKAFEANLWFWPISINSLDWLEVEIRHLVHLCLAQVQCSQIFPANSSEQMWITFTGLAHDVGYMLTCGLVIGGLVVVTLDLWFCEHNHCRLCGRVTCQPVCQHRLGWTSDTQAGVSEVHTDSNGFSWVDWTQLHVLDIKNLIDWKIHLKARYRNIWDKSDCLHSRKRLL